MKTILLSSPEGGVYRFPCEEIIAGVPINPVLPALFDDTPNPLRSDRSMAWWGTPYVLICQGEKGTRYHVRCLDGGAWDRSTIWGTFSQLEQAIALAITRTPPWLMEDVQI
jgi:hypothetical protein